MLNLYVLKRKSFYYDATMEILVFANSEREARELASMGGGHEPEAPHVYDAHYCSYVIEEKDWLEPDVADCIEVDLQSMTPRILTRIDHPG